MITNFMFTFWEFLLLNSLVAINSALFSIFYLNFKIKTWTKLTLTFFLFFITQILISEIILGTLEILNYLNIWLLNIFFLTSFITYLYKTKNLAKFKNLHFPILTMPTWFTFLSLFSPFLALFLIRYFFALYQVPIEYDSIAYHLPFVVEWFQTGSLHHLYYNAFAGPIAYYPSNFELLELWTFFPFHNDFFINFINFLLFPIFIISSYSVLKNFNIQEKIIWTGLLFLVSMPIFSHFLGLSHVDLFFIINFILAIYFLQEFKKSQNFTDLNLFALSLGLFIGTKYLGIPYAFPLILIATYLYIKISRNFNFNYQKNLKNISQLFSFILLGGSFWYIRNWLNSGNPIFPTDVKIGNFQIFRGYGNLTERIFNDTLTANIKDVFELNLFLDGFFTKAGIQTYIFPLLLIIATGYILFTLFQTFFHLKTHEKSKISRENCVQITLLLITAIFFFYLYWNAPYSYSNLIANIRYALPFFIITTLLFTLLIQKIKPLQPIAFFILPFISFYNLFFLSITSEHHQEFTLNSDKINLDWHFISENLIEFFIFIIFTLILVSSFYFLIILLKTKNKQNSLIFSLFIILTISLSTHIFANSQINREIHKEDLYQQHYIISDAKNLAILQANKWFDENANQAKIAYTGFNFHYHLFGRNLQREVNYININNCQNCRYVNFKNSKNSIRENPNFNHWLANLKAQNKTHLIIAPTVTPHVKNYEFEWAQKNTQIFKPVYTQDEIYIYQINYPSKKILINTEK